MNSFSLLVSFLAALLTGGLAGWLFVKRQEVWFYPNLALVFALLGCIHLAHGLGELDDERTLVWFRLALAGEVGLAGSLVAMSFRFVPPAQGPAASTDVPRVRLVGFLSFGLAGLSMTEFFLVAIPQGNASLPTLGDLGRIPYVFMVVTVVVALAQLERVYRASRELTRYRLKLMLIGLGMLGAYEIYSASEVLLIASWGKDHGVRFGLVSLMSFVLVGMGIARSRFKELLFIPQLSQQTLTGSVSVLIIGLYLLLVGLIGAWLRHLERPLGDELSIVVVLGALAVLIVIGSSKTTRNEIKRFVARHFARSRYDYRTEWLRVTEWFQAATTREAILDCLHDLLVKTFATTSITIWARREADHRYYQARPKDSAIPAVDPSHPLVESLLRQRASQDESVKMEDGGVNSDGSDPFVRLGAQLCFPIYVHDQLSAFVVLGRQPRGEPYGIDDCDLLRGICHHAGMLLSLARLAEERQASAELEALHRFSAFCLHDIKNLAARLSLVSQNAERHGHDPTFQQSALRAMADTAKKMTELIGKLSRSSVILPSMDRTEPLSLLSLVEDVVRPLRSDPQIRLSVSGALDTTIVGVREHIYQVLTNVVFNARQAIAEEGEIAILVARTHDSAIITVRDTGRGMPSTMLDRLFRPLQSSRPGGLGIGLYQCRKIIEAHGGTMTLQSEESKGTEVRIKLPLASSLPETTSGDLASPPSAIFYESGTDTL